MVIINYNIGENSRTIIADEVYTSGNGIPVSSLLTVEEKENPLNIIQDFFYTHYPIPESRSNLDMLCLRATVGGKMTQWNTLRDMYFFVQHFKKLLEAAYLISKKELPETIVGKITKATLVPRHILEKSKKFSHIQAFLPSSTDPADSFDPVRNLKFMFVEKSFDELLRIFDQTYQCALYGTRTTHNFYQDQLLHNLIFNVILDSCHMIYVRTPNKKLIIPNPSTQFFLLPTSNPKAMSQLFIHLSNIHNSNISIGGNCHSQFGDNSFQIFDLLLQSLEINRQLVAGISSQWSSEEELYIHLNKLITQHKDLELQVSQLLNP